MASQKISRDDLQKYNIVAVIPAYKVEEQITRTLANIPAYIRYIIVVNDASPDHTENIVSQAQELDKRIILVTHKKNQGVGGAVISGFKKALELKAQIVIKIDGDGQMSDYDLNPLLKPLILGEADYTKGNRFRDFNALRAMPFIRQTGNMGLSFLVKAATGYWNCFDPTNGFLAIRHEALTLLPLERIHKRFFFETALLGELYLIDAFIKDIPYPAVYGSETSNLSVRKTLWEFPPNLLLVFLRRILIKKILFSFGMDTIYLFSSLPMFIFGLFFGISKWIKYANLGIAAPTGTVMIPVICIILGFQLMLAAVNIDLQSMPKEPLSNKEPLEIFSRSLTNR